MVEIVLVRSEADAEAVYGLAYEFVDWLRVRYPEMATEIDVYLESQNFDDEMRDVLRYFNPPRGECLLATLDARPVGILMLKDRGGGVCEMNRMFLRESARGRGAGRALVERMKERARDMGFRTMVLSALPRHHEALALYRSCGFVLDKRPPEPGNSDNAVLMTFDLERD